MTYPSFWGVYLLDRFWIIWTNDWIDGVGWFFNNQTVKCQTTSHLQPSIQHPLFYFAKWDIAHALHHYLLYNEWMRLIMLFFYLLLFPIWDLCRKISLDDKFVVARLHHSITLLLMLKIIKTKNKLHMLFQK